MRAPILRAFLRTLAPKEWQPVRTCTCCGLPIWQTRHNGIDVWCEYPTDLLHSCTATGPAEAKRCGL